MASPSTRYRISVTPIEKDGLQCTGRCTIELEHRASRDLMRLLEAAPRTAGIDHLQDRGQRFVPQWVAHLGALVVPAQCLRVPQHVVVVDDLERVVTQHRLPLLLSRRFAFPLQHQVDRPLRVCERVLGRRQTGRFDSLDVLPGHAQRFELLRGELGPIRLVGQCLAHRGGDRSIGSMLKLKVPPCGLLRLRRSMRPACR